MLDRARQQEEIRGAGGRLRAGRKGGRDAGHERDDFRRRVDARRVERLLLRVIGKSRRVRHQLTHPHLLPLRRQTGDVGSDRVVECERSGLDELHDGDRRVGARQRLPRCAAL